MVFLQYDLIKFRVKLARIFRKYIWNKFEGESEEEHTIRYEKQLAKQNKFLQDLVIHVLRCVHNVICIP